MVIFNWIPLTTPTQTKELLNVFLSSFMPQGRSSSEQLSGYFDQKISPRLKLGQPLLVACAKNKLVGFAIFEKWEEQSYYLAEMAVLPEYQRQGIGKHLVFAIFAKEQDTKKILLITEKSNHWSQSFYEKIGFKPSSFQHPAYPQDFIGYEFFKTLNEIASSNPLDNEHPG